MKLYSLNLPVLYLLGCLLIFIIASAQPCVNAAFSLSYAASQSHLVNKSVAANDNTVITIGITASGNQYFSLVTRQKGGTE